MSRSIKKNPYLGNCADSDAWSKRNAAKKVRRRWRSMLQAGADGDSLPDERIIDSEWNFAKDGKSRFNPTTDPQWLRK